MTSSPLLLSLGKSTSPPALSASPCVTLYFFKAPHLFIMAKPCGVVAKGVVAKEFILSQGLLGRFLFQLQYAGGLPCFNHVMSLVVNSPIRLSMEMWLKGWWLKSGKKRWD